MTRTRTPRDLRERMERVATKPRRPSAAAPRRRASRPVEQPPADVPVARQRSRAETLIAWGMWELTVVPARRWRWLKTAIRGGDERARRHGQSD